MDLRLSESQIADSKPGAASGIGLVFAEQESNLDAAQLSLAFSNTGDFKTQTYEFFSV